MYFLIGQKNLLKNSVLLAKQKAKQVTSLNLRYEYLNYIKSIQPKNPVNLNKSIQWVSELENIQEFIQLFTETSILNDLDQQSVINTKLYNQGDASEKILNTKSAFNGFISSFPEFCEVFNFYIHTVFSAPSEVAGGGSTSGAIGVIWSNPRKHWTENDIQEILIHEFTHNAMFVDELCFRHYESLKEVSREENYPVSAILNMRRPIDKVLHALAVGTEVLCARQNVLGHPASPCSHPTSDLLIVQVESSIKSIRELSGINNLITSRAMYIVDRCDEEVSKIKKAFHSSIRHSVNVA